MSKLGVVEDTLFVPMLGRIYAAEHCPQILYDKKALELKNRLPLDLIVCRTSIPFWPLLPGLLIWIGLFGLFWNADRTV